MVTRKLSNGEPRPPGEPYRFTVDYGYGPTPTRNIEFWMPAVDISPNASPVRIGAAVADRLEKELAASMLGSLPIPLAGDQAQEAKYHAAVRNVQRLARTVAEQVGAQHERAAAEALEKYRQQDPRP